MLTFLPGSKHLLCRLPSSSSNVQARYDVIGIIFPNPLSAIHVELKGLEVYKSASHSTGWKYTSSFPPAGAHCPRSGKRLLGRVTKMTSVFSSDRATNINAAVAATIE